MPPSPASHSETLQFRDNNLCCKPAKSDLEFGLDRFRLADYLSEIMGTSRCSTAFLVGALIG